MIAIIHHGYNHYELWVLSIMLSKLRQGTFFLDQISNSTSLLESIEFPIRDYSCSKQGIVKKAAQVYF